MRYLLISLLLAVTLVQPVCAQNGYTPMNAGTICKFGQSGSISAAFTMGQVFCSTYDTVRSDSRFLVHTGFPYDAIYLGNTFKSELSASKGYYSDYVLLTWDIINNSNKIQNFVVYRRLMGTTDPFIQVAVLAADVRNWQDMYCESGQLYEYKLYADGIFFKEVPMMNSTTSVGFRSPMGTVTGRVTYSGGTSVSGVSVLAETTEGFQRYAAGFDGVKSFLLLKEKTSLTAVTTFSFQAWVKSTASTKSYIYDKENISSLFIEGDSMTFTVGNKSITQLCSSFGDRYFHVSAVRNGNELLLQLSDSATTLQKKITVSDLVIPKDTATSISFGQKSNGTSRLKGELDEVRMWNRALDSTEIARDFSRILSGKELGLKAYYRFDEAIGTNCYDISRKGYTFNENHLSMNDVSWSTTVPTRTQLALKGVTDTDGNYIIAGIPYSSGGSTYTLTPMIGVHKFEPTQALRYLASNADVHNNVDFSDKSSFSFKGSVFYDNSTFPVEGVNITIDGNTVFKGRNIVASDVNGEFSIDVPIGKHKISLVKQGHVFSQGTFPDKSYPDSTFDFQENIVERIQFYDATTALLVGRVAGGAVQAAKPLGFGVSRGNLGYGKIVLQTLKNKGTLRSVKDSSTVLINGNKKNATNYVIQDNKITIYPDTVTGEYALQLPPEQYIVNSAIAGDLEDVQEQYVFPSTALGTFNLDINSSDSVQYIPVTDSLVHTYRFNKRFNFIWNEIPSIEVTQNGGMLYGNPFMLYEGDTVYSWDKNGTYLLGYPLFKQNKEYSFTISVFENYQNKISGEMERVAVKKGVVEVTNDLSETKGAIVDTLDNQGVVNYTFVAGDPNMIAPYTQTMAVVSRCQQGEDTVTKTIIWDKQIEGIVFGAKSTGLNFVTAGPTELITILRDPAGSNSYSYLEKGTTIVKSWETTSASVYNMETLGTTHLGPDIELSFGVGVSETFDLDVTADASLGGKYSQSTTNGHVVEQSITTTERWETSNDPAYVGAMGDVFVGNSTNIVYGETNNLTLKRDTTIKDKAVYNFAQVTSYRFSPKFNTSFHYTQSHITNYLIPNLKMLRANLFASKPTIYIPKKNADDPMYYTNTKTKLTFGADTVVEGDSYDFVLSKQLKADKNNIGTEDSVAVYSRWISEWENILSLNEEEKVKAIKNNTLDKNHSFDAGTTYESSVTTEARSSYSNTFSSESYALIGVAGGFTFVGMGFTCETNHEIGKSSENSTTDDTTVTTTYGYVLSDGNAGDYLSVDVYKDNAGHGSIFRTRGGQTSCPYEGETVAQYYQPNKKHNLGAATMRLELPDISVVNPYQIDIPSTQAAVFDISLKNLSEVGATVMYELAVVDNSNPYGAIVKVDGATLGNGRDYAIAAGTELAKKLTIEKGVADVMKYDNIGIVLRSMCQADPTDDWEDISDTIFISAEFVPTCTDLTLATPLDKWTLNTETGTSLNTRITDFNKNDGNFVGIYLEYKESSGSEWKTLSAFFPDSTSAGYKAYNGTKQVIKGSEIQYVWDTKSNEDRTWDIRAKSVCNDNVYAYSEVASGTKDTQRPQVFGTPQPSDGILSPGEDIMVRFNEPLESGLVTKSNIMVQGVLNGATIDHSASLQLDGKASYAKADGISFTGQPITVEFWLQRDAGSMPGTIFAKGTNHERFAIATVDDKTMLVTLDTVSFTVDLSPCFTAEIPATAWHHYAAVYDNETNLITMYGDDRLLLDDKTVKYSPAERGSVFVGCSAESSNFAQANLQDVRIWNSARNQDDLYANMYTQLSGNEANLLAYWLLDEGTGTLVADRANAHNLTLHAGWNITPRGNAITFNGQNQALIIDGKSVVIDATRDATLEFWFKAATPAKRSCLLYNGLNDVVIDGKAPNSFGVYAEPDGTLSLLTRGTTSQATTQNVCDNLWHHFAVVVDRVSNIRTYVDGVLQAQLDKSLLADLAMPSMSLGTKRQVFSSTIDSTSMYFAGSIDELRVWQTARRASLINRYINTKLVSDEQALLLYYPFETYTTMMGMKTLTSSLKDETKADTVADAVKIGSPVFTSETPAVKEARPLQTLDASVVVNNDQLLIELPSDMAPRYEKRTLEITAYNVQDKNGNKLASPAQWIAYVEQNTVVWDIATIDVATTSEVSTTFTAQVVNKGGSAKTFSIGDLPAWLSTSAQSGTVQANSSNTITFTVNSGVNIGEYQYKITLSSDYGYDEVLEVNLAVKAKAPKWTVNPANYQYTMNVFGTVKISGVISTDEDDMVAAFVGDECRGVVNLTYLGDFDVTEAMLPIYSNTESGDSITLLVWDASEGKTYSNVTPVYKFAADAVHGSPDAPVLIECDASIRSEYSLNKGWNWISVNVDNPAGNSVQNLLSSVGSEGDEIKGQRSVFDKYSAAAGWSGSLTAAGGITPENMYKLKLTKAGTAKINGTPVDPQVTPVTIANGWNWIGFLPQYNMTVNEALASYGPVQGDLVKSQKAFSMYYDRIGWIGTLTVLEPGKGYMLKSQAASELTYPTQSSLKSSVEGTETLSISGYDASAFQSNMTIVASLADPLAVTEGKVLAAYSGSTIVGVASAINGTYFLVAGGNSTEQTLKFALVDTSTGQQTSFENQLAYSADANQGNVESPYILYCKSALGAAENTRKLSINVSPSLFSNQLSVTGYLPDASPLSVRMCDALGREIVSSVTRQPAGVFSLEINELAATNLGSLPAGVYNIEVITELGVNTFKVVKTKE